MTIENLIQLIKISPEKIQFKQVIDVINEYYNYTPVQFTNGRNDDQLINNAGKNEGSCKLFYFAKMHNLTEQETLACFGHYYRDEVLKQTEADNHANIRTFMRFGWSGIDFRNSALILKVK